jgi:hypothetical protein
MYESIVINMNANVMHSNPLLLGESFKIEHMYMMINQSVIAAVIVNLFMNIPPNSQLPRITF